MRKFGHFGDQDALEGRNAFYICHKDTVYDKLQIYQLPSEISETIAE